MQRSPRTNDRSGVAEVLEGVGEAPAVTNRSRDELLDSEGCAAVPGAAARLPLSSRSSGGDCVAPGDVGLRVEDVQYRWADTAAGKKRFKAVITPLHEAFHRDVVEPYLSQWRQYIYRLSVSMLTRAREHAVHERRRLNTLNYGDLLNVTARVLRENAHVRRALQQKYSFLFVDEFQDTDPVQAEIVFLLAADERNGKSGRGRTDWRKLPLRPGALFVVGDPKQSIYRFRRADIEIYNVVHDRFSDPATGRVLPLTLNFRSRPKLCQWANKVFETRFPAKPTPHSPRYAPLDPNPEDADQGHARKAGAGGVFTLTHTCDDASEVLAENADRIARYIRTEVD